MNGIAQTDLGRPPTEIRPEILSGGITIAAAILFVGTGADANLSLDIEGSSRAVAVTALLLNVALLIFAWRRHKDACFQATQRRSAEEKARLLSTRDQLTNLLVRTSLIDAGRQIVRIAREGGHSVALVVLNLDRFKQVNEAYGHIAGDTVLRAASDTISRLTDGSALCARIGADEFCLVSPMAGGGEKQITQLAERLIELLAAPFEINTVRIHISASAGLARLADDCADMESLLRRANIAMTVAKKSGGGRAVWFDGSMESALKARNEVEAGLRRGVPLGEFIPFYQPQIDLRTGAVRGFEALARWRHPIGGIVGPDIFIPVAEETGLIADLFESLCGQAVADAKHWRDDVTLSVNISPSQLKDPWLAQKILKILGESGLPPERLEIEITESSLFENLPLAQAIVASLKNHGVKLALDDFGTGYSSLANLRALPFDRIKIDRSFVQAMQKDRESLAIVTAIAKMGESLGVPVTAEGVTSAEVRDQLLHIGCDMGQGWLFGKPVPADETLLLLGPVDLLALEADPSGANAKVVPIASGGTRTPRPSEARGA